MQREVKFRAYDKRTKELIDILGYKYVGRSQIQLFYLDVDGDSTTCTCEKEFIELMQYTGLKDKNGKEIYEGDIVAHDFGFGNGKGIVYYSTPKFALKEVNKKAACDEFTWEEWEGFEVIGNIYENPELLTQSPTSTA